MYSRDFGDFLLTVWHHWISCFGHNCTSKALPREASLRSKEFERVRGRSTLVGKGISHRFVQIRAANRLQLFVLRVNISGLRRGLCSQNTNHEKCVTDKYFFLY